MPSPATQSSLPPIGSGGDATVIPLRAGRVPAQGDGADPAADLQQRLAATIQQMFLGEGQTLNDSDTADTFRVTVDAVGLIVDAALHQSVIDSAQHETLSGWVRGLRRVPDGLSRGE